MRAGQLGRLLRGTVRGAYVAQNASAGPFGIVRGIRVNEYREALENAKADLLDAIKKRDEARAEAERIEERVALLVQTCHAMAELLEQTYEPDPDVAAVVAAHYAKKRRETRLRIPRGPNSSPRAPKRGKVVPSGRSDA